MTSTAVTMQNTNMESLPFSENKLESLQKSSTTSGNLSDMSAGSVVIHEYARNSTSFTSSDDEGPGPVVQTALMVQLRESGCHVTMVFENGDIIPFRRNSTEDSTGNDIIPLKLGIVREKILVYGEAVESYENARIKNPQLWTKRFTSFNLWEQLLDSSKARPNIFSYDYNLAVHAGAELLLSLYLINLKNMVENDLNSAASSNSHQVNKIIFMIPLWFTSFHRQRMKDAAEIGGFCESFIVNETTALALIHIEAKRLSPEIPVNLLIFSENSGKIELTFYACKSDSFVKMLAVAGDRFSAWEIANAGYTYVIDAEKLNYQELMKQPYCQKRKFEMKTSFFQFLLNEIRLKLPHDIDAVNFVDCVFLSDSDQKDDWLFIMQKELKRNAITHYKYVGAPPVGIPKECWLSPRISLQDFFEAERCKTLSDLVPLTLRQTVSIHVHGSNSLNIEREIKTDLDGIRTAFPRERSVFYQKDIFGGSWEVGILQVKPLLYLDHEISVIETRLSQSWEGIFRLDTVFARNASGNGMKILDGETGDYIWTQSNLKAKEKEECAKKLREILDCNERYKEERSEVIEELWTICGDISQRLWNEEHSRRLGGKRKAEMEENVKASLEMIKEVSINNLIEVGREELKEKLMSWRQKYKAYF